MHSLFSDGELLPSELARRAQVLGHEVIAITDHVDASKLDIIPLISKAADDINDNWDITVVPGVEITHTPIETIDRLAGEAKDLGAKLVVVHGETLAEPVIKGTNNSAVNSKNVDILAHPGLLTQEDAEKAVDNNIFIEISARKGHCLANGHVANIVNEVGGKLLVNTDAHSPSDLLSFDKAYQVALGAGLTTEQANLTLIDNPRELLKEKGIL